MRTKDNVRWGRKSGVTILEALVVLTIMALVSAVVAPRVVGYLGRARSESAELQIQNLASAVQLFYIDLGRYPSDAEGLAVLIAEPSGASGWLGPYLSSDAGLADPWGRGYIYETADRSFTIRSLGRDGSVGGDGEDVDLVN
jgi:general secretion pathway protein G